MKGSVRVLATPAMAAGFRLAGLPTDEIGTPGDGASVFAARSTEPGVGVLLVEQRILDSIPESTKRPIERRPVPILVPIPSPRWGGLGEDGDSLIIDLLRRAIGYRVKLR